MRYRFVHCPATFTTLVLPTLGILITIFPFTHIQMYLQIKRKFNSQPNTKIFFFSFCFTDAKLISFLNNSKSFLRKIFKK